MNQLIQRYDKYITKLFENETQLQMALKFFRIDYILSGEEPWREITDAQIRVKFIMDTGEDDWYNMNFKNGTRIFYRNNKEHIARIEFIQLFENEPKHGWNVTHIYGIETFIALEADIDMEFAAAQSKSLSAISMIKHNSTADEDVKLWARLQ